jgi:hypothetical protein
MTTTPINRIKHYCEAPSTQTVAVEYDDVVQQALATMCRLMQSRDNAVAFNAANAVLEIEKARLRHKMPVAGSQPTQPSQQLPKHPAPVEPVQRESAPQRTGESEQFETAVDEFTVVVNRKQVKEGLPEYDPTQVRAAYELKLKEVGFDEFLKWHTWLMEMDNELLVR